MLEHSTRISAYNIILINTDLTQPKPPQFNYFVGGRKCLIGRDRKVGADFFFWA